MGWHNGSAADCTCDQCEGMRAAQAAYERDEAEKPEHDQSAPFEEHDWEQQEDEYGSLGDGGSYYVYKCRGCGKMSYSQMAD